MKTNHIEILHLEDEVMDAYLVRKILDRSHLDFNITVVGDKASFVKEILNRSFDLILADHSLPQFTAMEALFFLK
jgi:CheY-like chemotaxis protein